MEAQPHPAELDARLRARRIERRAELLEEARGQGRQFWLWVPTGLLAIAYLFWIEPSLESLFALVALSTVIGAADQLLSRRLDAIVKLLEEEKDPAAP